MNKLLVVIPFCTKDEILAAQLLRWMAELQPGSYKPHSILLAVDHAVPESRQKEIFQLGKPMFEHAELLRIPVPSDKQGWIPGSNYMFEQVSKTISECIKSPWLWCEPDCVPLCPGWLDRLALAYDACPRRFMGAHIRAVNQPTMPHVHLAGCAIYDCEAYKGMKDFVEQQTVPFDIAAANWTYMRSANSPLFQYFWGKPDLAPTFRETKADTDPENTIPMGYIRSDAVFWHRCKDGTLIDCLRARHAAKYLPAVEFPKLPVPTQEFASEPIVKRGPGRPRKTPALV